MEKIVELYYIQSNNHGCSGERIVIAPLNEREGVVKACYSCSRCYDPLPFEEGDIVALPDWCSSWEEAKLEEEFENSFSFAGETTVRPEYLIVVSRSPAGYEEE